ncbi:unnamed protein product [Oreochromis niloticus]|nr:unnamed protein product [Mustela putorius furo]
MSEQPVHLRRNAKLADVYSCVELEDFDASALQETTLASSHQSAMSPQVTPTNMEENLKLVGLGDVDIESCTQSPNPLVLAEDAVTAVLQSHVQWDVGPRGRAMEALHHLPQMVSPGLEALPAYSERELRDAQLQDAALSRVVFYVERHRRPSRRERVGDPVLVKRYLSHWEKLVLKNGVLYRVSRVQISGSRRLQFVVPESLKAEVLQGIHDDAGPGPVQEYVVSLREDVKEAMVITRARAAQEKRRHSQLYNRRVKGSRIEVGDRVLVANRKERGKKKVADRWESPHYTVIDVNPDTHTFKIRDSVSGRERVVHWNLLLVANFLPLDDDVGTLDHVSSTWDVNTAPEDDDEAASGEGDLNVPAVSCVGAHGNRSPNAMDGTADLEVISEPLDPGDRTIAWVSQLTESSRSVGDVTDVSSVDSVLPAASGLSVGVDFDRASSSTTSQEVNIATSCGEGVQACSTTPDVAVDVVAPAIAAQPPMVDYSQTGNTSQIRTRLGRLVKPVNRLIQTM